MSFIPYGRQSIDQSDIDAVVEVLQSDFLTTGPKVAEFENAICDYTGAKYAVAVSSGTAALHIASLALINKGDKVVCSPITFAATSNSVLYSGGEPVFCDISADGNLDLDKCAEMLRADSSIKHLYVTHMTGRPADQAKLAKLKSDFGVIILEDCAHSLGGTGAGGCVNSDCSILSFHPVKHITTGEGGAVTTNSKGLYDKLVMLRTHGITKGEFKNSELAYDKKGNLNPWYYEMHDLGFNYRITDIQCALGLSQFSKLDGFISRRREVAKQYENAFVKDGIFAPLYQYDGDSAYHLFVVQADFDELGLTKAELFNKMRDAGIGLQLHYIPVPMLPYYSVRGYGIKDLPNAVDYYDKSFSIPIYPSMTDTQVKQVIDLLYKNISA